MNTHLIVGKKRLFGDHEGNRRHQFVSKGNKEGAKVGLRGFVNPRKEGLWGEEGREGGERKEPGGGGIIIQNPLFSIGSFY